MNKNAVLVNIKLDTTTLAEQIATKIGWERGTEKFLKCLHCTQGCHYNRYPKTREEFWNGFREILLKNGIDAEPIYEAMRKKIATKDWKTTIAFSQKDLLGWIMEQLNSRPDQP